MVGILPGDAWIYFSPADVSHTSLEPSSSHVRSVVAVASAESDVVAVTVLLPVLASVVMTAVVVSVVMAAWVVGATVVVSVVVAAAGSRPYTNCIVIPVEDDKVLVQGVV